MTVQGFHKVRVFRVDTVCQHGSTGQRFWTVGRKMRPVWTGRVLYPDEISLRESRCFPVVDSPLSCKLEGSFGKGQGFLISGTGVGPGFGVLALRTMIMSSFFVPVSRVRTTELGQSF